MTPEATASRRPWSDRAVLCLVLLLAAALRLFDLGHPGYSYDECWKAELSAGQGSAHLRLPVDAVFRPPDLYDPRPPAPAWRVWSTMECTHPPLYYLQLRFWTDLFGRGDRAERACAAVTSLAAIALLFDAARLLNGRAVATWAALLMAVAVPQIEQARLASNYALELATVLAAVDAVVRIEVLGATRRRLIALAGAVLAALLTHYFAAGAVAGLGVYAVVRLRGQTRVLVVLAFAAAGAAYLVVWGPFMWQQRRLFATDDAATVFLQDAGPGHVGRVVATALAVPFQMLARPPGSLAAVAWVLAPLYALPVLLYRRRPGLLLWAAVLLGSVGLIVGLDLARQTQHVAYARYLILAGPGVCVLVPATARSLPWRWLARAVPALAAALCVASVGQAYRSATVDPLEIAAAIRATAGPDDLIVLLGTGPTAWTAGTTALILTRYLRPFPSPLVLEHGPPGPAVLAQARRSRRVFVFAVDADPRPLFPGLTPAGTLTVGGQRVAWILVHQGPVGRGSGTSDGM